ncbi:hypothetical protein J3R82DRAFT_10546, partial [Butyriboletus roseoflavus]
LYACITTVFYCVTRLGEFTVPAISKFNPSKHILHHNVEFLWNNKGHPVLKFSLLATKYASEGKDMQCAPQSNCTTDPEVALQNHFRINIPLPDAHLLTWKHQKGGLHPLSKNKVILQRVAIAKQTSLSNLKGHSLHIGRTLFYLLKGVPFDI